MYLSIRKNFFKNFIGFAKFLPRGADAFYARKSRHMPHCLARRLYNEHISLIIWHLGDIRISPQENIR